MFKGHHGFKGHGGFVDCGCMEGGGHGHGRHGFGGGHGHGHGHGAGHHFGSCCTGSGQGGHHGVRRRFISPAEKTERLESYIETLKKELEGAEHALSQLD